MARGSTATVTQTFRVSDTIGDIEETTTSDPNAQTLKEIIRALAAKNQARSAHQVLMWLAREIKSGKVKRVRVMRKYGDGITRSVQAYLVVSA
jgi:hypothetical protein